MPKVGNQPGSYLTRSDLSKVGAAKDAVRKPKPLGDMERQQMVQRLSTGVGHGGFVDLRPIKHK